MTDVEWVDYWLTQAPPLMEEALDLIVALVAREDGESPFG